MSPLSLSSIRQLAGSARRRLRRSDAQRTRRAMLGRARPDAADREQHSLRVELSMARAEALRTLHWTQDVVPVTEVERFFGTFSLVDPGIPYVRLGGPGDGGYVLPDDLDGLVGCLSPGVADRADFEAAMVSRGVPCHLMDGSVDGPPIDHELVSFRPEFLGGVERAGWTTLQRWVDEDCPPIGDLILQMDIEGHEWQVLASVPGDVLRRFRMLVLELHDMHLLVTRSGLNRAEEVFRRLDEDFVLVNVHPNNYEFPVAFSTLELHPVVETTWLRTDRVRDTSPGVLRHPLEASNDPELPDFELDPRWA